MLKYLLTLFIFSSTITSAQLFKFETLGTIKEKKSLSDLVQFENNFYGLETFAGSKFGWTMTLEKAKSGCRLIAYDKNLNLLKENSLAEGKEVFGPFSSFYKIINNKLFFIYYKYDSKTGVEIFAARVDPVALNLFDDKKILTIEQKNVGLFKSMNLFQSYDLVIKSSPDNSKNLFFWMSGVNNDYFYSVADAEMNVKKSGAGELENVKDEYTLNNMLIDNSGNFYGAYMFSKKDEYFSYLMAGNTAGAVKIIELPLEETTAHNVFVAPSDNSDQIKVFGTTSKDGTYISGMFQQTMNKKGFKFSKTVLKDIPEDIIEKYHDDSYAMTKKKNYGLYPLIQFDDFIMADGTLILAGDLTRYQTTGATSSSPVKGSSVVLIFNPDGNITISRLPKKEEMGQKIGNNFFAHKWGDKLVLLYTDVETNINTPLDQAKKAHFTDRKDVSLAAAIIEKDGRITRRILHPNTSESFYFSPGSTSSIDDNTLLLGLGKDKVRLTSIKTTYAFFKLSIENE